MLNMITPEQAGVSSKELYDCIKSLVDGGYNFHGIAMAKGDNIFFESYFSPFTKNMPHRMYSQTKSYVSLAIGVLYDRGLLDLDKLFYTYFPEYEKYITDENFKAQTIRDMLTMTGCAEPTSWFKDKPQDRLQHYFSSPCPRLPGAWFDYDSEGSFALGCLVEKLSGMPLLSFMKENFLNDLGFENAKMLSCPGGHAWGDSALICTLRDMLAFGRLVMNKGTLNGKEYISKKYMDMALSCQSAPMHSNNAARDYAYGFQIWKPRDNVYSFNGMGGQFTIMVPDKDFVFSCTADNQSDMSNALSEKLFEKILKLSDNIKNWPLPENRENYNQLLNYANSQKIRTAHKGLNASTIMQNKIENKVFICKENPMGWKWFKFNFGEVCTLSYENDQGEKALLFGMNKNILQPFPQLGYADKTGTDYKNTRLYSCAVSGAWDYGNKLNIFVQIIDEYLGRASLNFVFPDENSCGMLFEKSAEDFLWEYDGEGTATAE